MQKTNTQQIRTNYYNYLNSNKYTLDDVYKNYSIYKQQAYNYCMDLMQEYNGGDLKIIAKNDMFFTAGFVGYVDGKEAFIYITKNYDRYMYL